MDCPNGSNERLKDTCSRTFTNETVEDTQNIIKTEPPEPDDSPEAEREPATSCELNSVPGWPLAGIRSDFLNFPGWPAASFRPDAAHFPWLPRAGLQTDPAHSLGWPAANVSHSPEWPDSSFRIRSDTMHLAGWPAVRFRDPSANSTPKDCNEMHHETAAADLSKAVLQECRGSRGKEIKSELDSDVEADYPLDLSSSGRLNQFDNAPDDVSSALRVQTDMTDTPPADMVMIVEAETGKVVVKQEIMEDEGGDAILHVGEKDLINNFLHT
jgi:hypothetical protein